MSKDKTKYRLRYMVEDWDKPVPEEDKGQRTQANVVVSKTDYGYTDRLFLISMLEKPDGSIGSCLLLDSEDGPYPTKEYLEGVIKLIQHHIEHHT